MKTNNSELVEENVKKLIETWWRVCEEKIEKEEKNSPHAKPKDIGHIKYGFELGVMCVVNYLERRMREGNYEE